MSIEELAKTLRAAVTDEEKQRAWDRLHTWEQGEYLSMARAARDFYKIPESAEKGAVGKAVALLRDVQSKYDICDLDYYTGYARGGIDLALRELGEEVSRG